MSLFYRNRNSLVGKKVKNTVLTKVERNLVSKMSDDTKKKRQQQQLFLSNGLVIANAILALKKRLLHNVSLFIFLVFSKPNCLLTELFQQLVQYNRRTNKKPLT